MGRVRLGLGLGRIRGRHGRLGTGLLALFRMGIHAYYNPYYAFAAPTTVVVQPAATTTQSRSIPPPSLRRLGHRPGPEGLRRGAGGFKAGDYAKALALADQALKAMPNDSVIHEFRAITLFALGRYDDAAATLYGVLSVGPGWDWTTLISLYPDVDVYTEQLRALEQYTRANPSSAAGRFVQAYLYLTAGQNQAATEELKAVTELQPKDRVSAQLLQSLTKAQSTAAAPDAAPTPPATPPPAASKPEDLKKLAGTWTASPSKDSTIALTISADGKFTWKVDPAGQSHQITGQSTIGGDVLTLAQDGRCGPSDGRPGEVGRRLPLRVPCPRRRAGRPGIVLLRKVLLRPAGKSRNPPWSAAASRRIGASELAPTGMSADDPLLAWIFHSAALRGRGSPRPLRAAASRRSPKGAAEGWSWCVPSEGCEDFSRSDPPPAFAWRGDSRRERRECMRSACLHPVFLPVRRCPLPRPERPGAGQTSGEVPPPTAGHVFSPLEGRTTVLSAKPEGSFVKKGELVCELDPSPLKERLANQEIVIRGAEAALRGGQAGPRGRRARPRRSTLEGISPQEMATLRGEIALAESDRNSAEDRWR